ncbi:hypothetical protein TrVE_jg8900 [Triparma verrucosa]|uniref:Cullin N-terminal domain-containing protein n=1 Tax=Triparma verrucosa TaxID=1606542 RepID=A0A9W7EW69_9STRA|nr:hypothetical protein TrVE_jg8900 [Triparma verrucosa]
MNRSGLNANGANKPKIKLKIKGFAKPPTLPTDFYSKTSELLLKSSRSLLKAEPITETRESLYRNVEDCCVHKHSQALYTSLQDLISEHCRTHILPSLQSFITSQNFTLSSLSSPSSASTQAPLFLSLLTQLWSSHLSSTTSLRSIYLYLDRSWSTSAYYVGQVIL